MTTHIDTTPTPAELGEARMRPPVTVIVAAVLTIAVASVGTYGAVYFSAIDGYHPVDATFVSIYGYLAVLGIVAAIAQLQGSAIGRAGVIAWALFGVLFTVVKLITIQEVEAIGFGVVSLAVLALEFTPPTLRFIRSRQAASARS